MRLRTHAQSSNLAHIPGVAHGAHKQPLSGRRWRSLRVVPQPHRLGVAVGRLCRPVQRLAAPSTADWPETQAAARAAAAEAEAAWAAAAAAAERAAAATTKILAHRRRGHRLKIFLACGALTAWRLTAQRTFAVGRRAAKSRCEFLQVLIARPRKR